MSQPANASRSPIPFAGRSKAPIVALALAALWQLAAGPAIEPARGLGVRTLDSLPLRFVPNAGQSHPAVRYQVHGWRGGTLYFEPEGLALAIPDGPAFASDGAPSKIGLPNLRPRLQGSVTVLGLRFQGAHSAPPIEAADPSQGRISYLLGRDPAGWRQRLPSYGALTYRGLYPGIDLRYDGSGGRLKGTWQVAPGADPALIAWRYEGAASVRIVPGSGDLRIALPDEGASGPRALIEQAPIAWQEARAGRVPVEASFRLGKDGRIGFQLGDYDPTRPLTIDPSVLFASYLGGGSRDWGYDIALDPAGNIYVAGGTSSIDFPTQSPLQAARGRSSQGYFIADAFVSKLSPDGQRLIYSTYLGGNEGADNAQSLAVDAAGSVALTGETHATDFPIVKAFQAAKSGQPVLPSPAQGEGFDSFVARLSPDGSQLLFGSYFGGDGRDEPQSIAYAPNGDLVFAGHTLSPSTPLVKPLQAVHGGSHDGFVARIDGSSYQLLWSTYLGGSSSDMAWGIAVDAVGGIFVAGQTSSLDFPTARPLQAQIASSPNRTLESDMFLAHLSADGQRLDFSSYLGGIGEDRAIGVDVERGGDAVFTGMSGDPGDFPLVRPIQSSYEGRARNAVVLKLAADGQALRYATFLGDSGDDWGVDVDLDAGDNAWLVGRTTSAEFPVQDPTQPLHAGANDSFVAALTPDGQRLIFSTWIGGSGHDMGLGIAVRPDGTAHITGWTGSPDYPLVNPLQAAPGGGDEAFIAQIGEVAIPPTPVPPRPTALVEPTPTARQAGSCVCEIVRARVPSAVVANALANPEKIAGWGLPLDPSKPPSPANPPRECLTLRTESLDYHPLFNAPMWKVGCR